MEDCKTSENEVFFKELVSTVDSQEIIREELLEYFSKDIWKVCTNEK